MKEPLFVITGVSSLTGYRDQKLEVLEFIRGAEIATVVTDGSRVNCYEPLAFGSFATMTKAIAHLEGNGWSILIR